MKKYFLLVVILIVGAILRFYHNLDISIWHDEAFSALMIRYPWGEMFRRLALDVHPPMYYIFLKLWYYIFGDKVLALRGFSIMFGVLTIWATWLFTKYAFTRSTGSGRAESEKLALWVALLVCVSPFQLQYILEGSTEARMYTMGAFFSILTAYFLVRALREQKEFYADEKLHPHTKDNNQQNFKDHLAPQHQAEYIKPGSFGVGVNMPNLPQDIKLKKSYRWHFFWFAVCAGIIDFTHYYLLFTMAALCLYALIYHVHHYRKNYKRYAALLSSYVLIIVFFLPWLKQFISQYKGVQASYWIPPMDVWSIPGTLWTMLLGVEHNNANPTTQIVLILVVLFSIFFFWQFLRKTQYFEKWLIVLATIAPFCGAILFLALARLKHSSSSVYEERYFFFCSAFYIMALAVWLSEIKIKWLSTLLLTAYALFNIFAYVHYWTVTDISALPGMNGAAKFLGANVAAGDHVFVGTPYEFFNYKYYDLTYYPLPSGVRPLWFTSGRASISQISSVEGVAMLTDQDLVPNFAQAVHPADTVWLIWTQAFNQSKPQVPLNWTQVDENQYPDIRPYLGTTIYVDEYKVN